MDSPKVLGGAGDEKVDYVVRWTTHAGRLVVD